jgi:hypothetical protein
VFDLFKSAPRVWIDARQLMAVGGSYAWRTRVCDAQKVVEAEGGAIENRQRTGAVRASR